MSKRTIDYADPLYQTQPKRGNYTADRPLYCYVTIWNMVSGGQKIFVRRFDTREERNHKAGGVFQNTGHWPVSYFTVHEDGRIEVEEVCPKCGVLVTHLNDGICELCSEASTPPIQIEEYQP